MKKKMDLADKLKKRMEEQLQVVSKNTILKAEGDFEKGDSRVSFPDPKKV